jgi:hypothetical protein
LENNYFEDRKGDGAMIRMCFRKTDGGDSSNVEVFSNSVLLVDIYNTGLLLNVLHKKGKSILLQAWTGPEGSSRLKLPDFKKIGT